MARSRAPLGQADQRPRVHVWPQEGGFAWSIGPAGRRSHSHPSPGRAINEALEHLFGCGVCKPAVIITEEAA